MARAWKISGGGKKILFKLEAKCRLAFLFWSLISNRNVLVSIRKVREH